MPSGNLVAIKDGLPLQPSQKSRHFGMDAEIQAMPVLSEAEGDGNPVGCAILDSWDLPSPCYRMWIQGHLSRPQFAILGRWMHSGHPCPSP